MIPGYLGEVDAASGGRSTDASFCLASHRWSFQNALDLSMEDPFCEVRHETAY